MPWILIDTLCIDMNNIYLKRHGQGKKIRGHNIQLWPLIAIYVWGVWRPSKSPVPVIYQHILIFSVTILHNLSSFHLTFSDRAPRLNSFHGEFVMKPYHKIVLKGFLISLKNAWKTSKNRRFSTINIKINFGHDRRRVGFKCVLTTAQIFFAWNHKVSGDAKGRAPRSKARS